MKPRSLNDLLDCDDAPQVLECIQEPGDVMYIPMDWGHGILNLAESVGYAVEFDVTEHEREELKASDVEGADGFDWLFNVDIPDNSVMFTIICTRA